MKWYHPYNLMSGMAMASLAAGSIFGREYPTLDTQKVELGEIIPPVQRFASLSDSYNTSLDNLYSAYKQAYQKTETVVVTCFDSEGKASTCIEEETYWDEDQGVPSHQRVYNWINYQDKVNEAAQLLVQENLVDARGLDKVTITDEGVPTGIAIGLVGIYGAEIGLLLGYEKIAERMGLIWSSSDKRKQNMQLARRIVLKSLASFATGVGVAYYVQNNQDESRSQLKQELKELEYIQKLNAEVSFAQYFGSGLNDMRSNVRETVSLLESTFSRVRKAKVHEAYENVIRTGTDFELLLSEGVSEDLGLAAQCGLVTRKIGEINRNFTPLLEALVAGGVLTAIILPGEIINQKLSK
ncbi:MAG TPA: hypothetical protein VJC39_00565 [Candidatus Nanoarchaeia archaeon]|nr:hypothetical protein [Candidatus Nanoarchaeia archaeon]